MPALVDELIARMEAMLEPMAAARDPGQTDPRARAHGFGVLLDGA
jgi:hypothetical protein